LLTLGAGSVGGLATALPQYFHSQFAGDQITGDSEDDATDCLVENFADDLADGFVDTESNYV